MDYGIGKELKRIIEENDRSVERRADLLSRGRELGPDVLKWTEKALADGVSLDEISRYQLDIVCPVGGQAGEIRSFRQVSDQEFFDGLSNPTQYKRL